MKAWFVRWRISAALDEGRAPWEWLRHWAGRSRELRTIEPELIALDRALRQTAPRPAVPASLHQSIMGAVRAAVPVQEPRAALRVSWVTAMAAMLIGLALAGWGVTGIQRKPAVDAQALAAATTTLEQGRQLAQAAPVAVVAPLSDELTRLNQDLERTAEFVLASVP